MNYKDLIFTLPEKFDKLYISTVFINKERFNSPVLRESQELFKDLYIKEKKFYMHHQKHTLILVCSHMKIY